VLRAGVAGGDMTGNESTWILTEIERGLSRHARLSIFGSTGSADRLNAN
jgi:hypothetical protein